MSIVIDPSSSSAILKIKNLDKLTRSGVKHAAYASGVMLKKATSAEILKRPKGGRVYSRRIAGGRRRHVASAPGETHANRTGTLRRSLSFKASVRELDFGYGVGGNDAPDYAAAVEFGTSKMSARPSLQNGIKSQRTTMMNNFDREIGKRLEGRGGIIS